MEVDNQAETMTLQQLENHKKIAKIQKDVYCTQIKDIQQGKLVNTILIIQDFTQLDGNSTFYQDLIFSVYLNTSGTAGDYFHHNYHFVAAASNGIISLASTKY